MSKERNQDLQMTMLCVSDLENVILENEDRMRFAGYDDRTIFATALTAAAKVLGRLVSQPKPAGQKEFLRQTLDRAVASAPHVCAHRKPKKKKKK